MPTYKTSTGVFLKDDKTYHPALSYIIAINEPDLKLPNLGQPFFFAKGVASAIDGMLDAERDANVTGRKPNFTATFSFSRCDACAKFADHPGLAQMWMLRDAMQNPSKYGLSPNNDLASFYKERFTNSFNTGNPSWDIRKLFLDRYEKEFPHTPVFIGEYHNPGNQNTELDLQNILSISKASPVMLGVSFFEWQNRLDTAGHTIFGIFDVQENPDGSHDLGASPNPEEAVFGVTFGVSTLPCMTPVMEGDTGKTIPEQITGAYGGPGLDFKKLCQANAATIVVSDHGFKQVQNLHDMKSMQQFIARVTRRFGAEVDSASDVPDSLTKKYIDPAHSFESLKLELDTHPHWASWSAKAACFVDRDSTTSQVGNAVSYVCGLGHVDCTKIPDTCKANIWATASYVFGSNFQSIADSLGEAPDPFKQCSFDGAARFSSPKDLDQKEDVPSACIVPVGRAMPYAKRVQITPQGFREIVDQDNSTKTGQYINRVVRHMGGTLRIQSSTSRYSSSFGAGVPQAIAEKYLRLGQENWTQGWKALTDEISQHPSWTAWNSAACVFEPEASDADIGKTLGYVCSLGVWDCKGIPATCQDNLRNKAAFALGSYFKALVEQQGGTLPDPLTKCHFDGAALFISTDFIYPYIQVALTDLNKNCLVPISVH